MERVLYRITIDLDMIGRQPMIYLKETSVGSIRVIVRLQKDGESYEIADDSTVTAYAQFPDGKLYQLQDCKAEDGSIVLALNVNLPKGDTKVEFTVRNGEGYTFTTQPICFRSQYALHSDELLEKDEYFPVLEKIAEADYLKKVDAKNTYLGKSDAKNTYLGKDEAQETYIGKDAAQETYLGKDEAKRTYLNKNDEGEVLSGILQLLSGTKNYVEVGSFDSLLWVASRIAALMEALGENNQDKKFFVRNLKENELFFISVNEVFKANSKEEEYPYGFVPIKPDSIIELVMSENIMSCEEIEEIYLPKSEAKNTYLKKVDAKNTYLEKDVVRDSYNAESEDPISGKGVKEALDGLPIRKGSDEKSVVVADGKAISEAAIAGGKDEDDNVSIAGCKGFFYYTYSANTLTLSLVQGSEQWTDEAQKQLNKWAIGTKINVVGSHKHTMCSEVKAIDGNVVTVDKLPFGEQIPFDNDNDNKYKAVDWNTFVAGPTTWDDGAVYAPELPDTGVIKFGRGARSIGADTKASGTYSVAEGKKTVAANDFGHAEGRQTKAGYASHAEGYGTAAIGQGAHSEGHGTNASAHSSHAEGNGSVASGDAAHAEGVNVNAEGVGSHAEGQQTKAKGNYSHAEGVNTINVEGAVGIGSHVEGANGTAKGNYSHVEGLTCKTAQGASGAHAEGEWTEANAQYSHAEGWHNTINERCGHVQGKYNDLSKTTGYAHIVGGGTSESDRKNIHTLDWEGNAVYAGSVSSKDGELATKGKMLDSLFPPTQIYEDITEKASDYVLPSDDVKIVCETEIRYVYVVAADYPQEVRMYVKDSATSPFTFPDDFAEQEYAATVWKAGSLFEGGCPEKATLIMTKEQEDKTAISPTRLAEILENERVTIKEDIIGSFTLAEEVSV